MKDPEIILFGKKISLPDSGGDSAGGEYSGESSDESKSNCRHKKRKRSEHTFEVSRDDQNHDKSNEDQTSNSETITDQEDVDQSQSPPPDSENEPTKQNLKKPDKILPCPRCNSKDTKFCYYNNYNVNQPRHFCRSCQRYWTAGGTMRHIPVGSGRRKNKNSTTTHYRINNDETFHGYNHHQTKFKILSFRSDPSTYSPNVSVKNGSSSFSCKNEERVAVRHCNGLFQTSQVPFGSAVMWPFPRPIPGILYPGYPIPVWNSLPINANSSSCNDSKLGKHSRNEDHKEETSLVIPKTLRIDDPEEAAKSSIWTTLGIKYDRVAREDLFESLQSKKDVVSATTTTTSTSLLQSNPAALSRSFCFQESV